MVQFPALCNRNRGSRADRIHMDRRKARGIETSGRPSRNHGPNPTLAAKTETRRGWGTHTRRSRISRRDMAKKIRERIIASSGNVFADLGLPDAVELDTKVRLGAAICRIVERRRLTQAQVSAALGVNQPKVSALLRACRGVEGFSVERLMGFLTATWPRCGDRERPRPRARSARLAERAE